MKEKFWISVDFIGAYGWRGGGNCADSWAGFPEDLNIPKELTEEFAEWQTEFEKYSYCKYFNWDKFDKEGIKLSKKLNELIKKDYDLIYLFTSENPEFDFAARPKVEFQ